MVKGHRVDKVKELEEIKLLRKYNKDLRDELSGHNRVTIKTPDEDEEDINDKSLSSDSASNNHMGLVFGYLNVRQLKECRLVCRDWNKRTCSILSNRNNGKGLPVNLGLKVLYKDEDSKDVEGGFVKNDDRKRTQEIHSVVEAAPENWFRNINLHDNPWGREAYKKVFQDFGNRLKVIKVTSEDLHIQTLRSILLDWCPNLEEFAFRNIDMEVQAFQVLEISRPLKLTSLSFKTYHYNGFMSFITLGNVVEVLFTIIKNSPNLVKLESFGKNTAVAKQIFTKLQNYPQIMGNLEEIFLRNESLDLMNPEDMQDPLEVLSKMQFNSKLKTLVLTEIQPGQSIALNRFLDETNGSLEKLTLISNIDPRFPTSVEESNFYLKRMNCLQKFRYHADRPGVMNSIDILTKMPNLRIFVFGFERQYSFCYREDDIIDRMFSNCRRLMKIPHQNLKELYLFGYIQNPKATFNVMERGFPNLSTLVVGICPKKQLDELDDDCSDLFEGISNLTKLNKLFLDFSSFHSDSVYPHFSYRMEMIFSYFKTLPNLTHLAMRGGESHLNQGLFFDKIPKLQRLTLIGVKMDLVKAKKLKQLLGERSIFLDLKDSFQFPEDGIKWDLEF